MDRSLLALPSIWTIAMRYSTFWRHIANANNNNKIRLRRAFSQAAQEPVKDGKTDSNLGELGEQPSLKDFLRASAATSPNQEPYIISNRLPRGDPNLAPYLDQLDLKVDQVPVYIKTYGCQMNVNDTEIISAILREYGYTITNDQNEAEIHLIITCAIRDSAEHKIWDSLKQLKKQKQSKSHPLRQVGLLGCMAERLKEKVLDESKLVDIVAGPDAYRDLPKLFAINNLTNRKAVNCLLSFDETYSDIPSSNQVNKVTCFVSITRGCDNLCSYCIVPFTRGRERSRPIDSILEDIRQLHRNGVKEVTLLGQNVNSYRDMSNNINGTISVRHQVQHSSNIAKGFNTIYKPKRGGLTFDVLLEEVAKISPELRIRFTSPHPKDFTDQVIDVMQRHGNIAKCIHLPAQSGNNDILNSMRRGYTREAYLQLVQRLRASLGSELAITSDFIVGFCGETEEAHKDTIDLIKEVRYNFIYVFPYSRREKTHAYHTLIDNVDFETKLRRLEEVHVLYRSQSEQLNRAQIGTRQLVLIESESKRSNDYWQGRADNNVKVIIPKSRVIKVGANSGGEQEQFSTIGGGYHCHVGEPTMEDIKPGDYVACRILDANSQTMKGQPEYITLLNDYHLSKSA